MAGSGDTSERQQSEAALRTAQQCLELALSASGAGLWDSDFRSGRTQYSPSWRRLLGYNEEELGDSFEEWMKVIHPEDAARLQAYVRQYLRDPSAPYEIEFRVRHKDGTYRWVLSRATLIRSADGTPQRLLGLHVDITERREAEAVSAALARVGQGLITALGNPTLLEQLCQLTAEVLACECSHTVLEQGKGGAYKVVAAHGYSAEQLEGMRAVELPDELLRDVLARLDRAEVSQSLTSDLPERILTGRRQLGITAEISMALRRGGKVIGVHSASYRGRQSPFSPLQERIAGGIAHLASLALENFRLVQQLERASNLKSDFVATMSHELRTPLSILLGYNDLLREEAFGPLLPAQVDILQRMDSSARELFELINATLDFSRLETGQVPLQLEDVEPAELIQDIRAEMQDGREKKPAVSYQWDIAPGLPRLRTDRAKTKVVLKNLISNAVKFTDQGHVAIGVATCDGGIKFTISDTGIGIAPEMLPVIFEPFRQIHRAGSPRRAGVGLGLYIVHRLLSLTGGRINVRSQPGAGSTFQVCLPLVPGGRVFDAPEGAFQPVE